MTIKWKTPCEIIGRPGHHTSQRARSVSEFKRIINGLKDKPKRLDVHNEESAAFIQAAHDCRVGYSEAMHADRLRDEAGFSRVLVYKKQPMETYYQRGRTYRQRTQDQRDRARLLYTENEILDGFCNCRFDYRFLWPQLEDAKKQAAMTEDEIRREAAGIVTRFDSERDVAVFALNGLGLSVREIGAKLHISVGTVSAALKRIEKNIGVRVARHKGGGGTHAGNAYRHNGSRRDRTHNPAVEQ